MKFDPGNREHVEIVVAKTEIEWGMGDGSAIIPLVVERLAEEGIEASADDLRLRRIIEETIHRVDGGSTLFEWNDGADDA